MDHSNDEGKTLQAVQDELEKRLPPAGDLIDLDTVISPSGRLSIGMECMDRDLWDPFPAMPRLKTLGIRRARLQSGWGRTEREKGVYDFSWLDRVIDGLLAIGVEPWLSLSYGNYLYASPEDLELLKSAMKPLFPNGLEELEQKLPLLYGLGHNPARSATGMAGWLNYVSATVLRYRGKIRYYEIWNEPDVRIFFPGDSWADEYLTLVCRTAPVIRENDPDAMVVGGSAGRDARMEQLLSRGIGNYVDIESFHGYHEFPEKFGLNSYRAYRAAVDRYAPGVKLWRGEAGCPSKNPEGGHGALSHIVATEEKQAQWIARNIVNDLAMPELELSSYFHLYDFLHFSRKYRYHYGVLRADYSPKPAYHVLQACAKLLDGETIPAADLLLTPESGTEHLQINTVIRGFRRRGEPVFACWLADGDSRSFRIADFNFWAAGGSPLRNPVAIDLLTRKVYALKLKDARVLGDVPVMPYPLILAEYSTFADVISMKEKPVESEAAADSSEKQRFEA